MKKSFIFLTTLFVLHTISCYGMEKKGKMQKLKEESEKFYLQSQELNRKAQREAAERKKSRDKLLHTCSFGLLGNNEESRNQQTNNLTPQPSQDYFHSLVDTIGTPEEQERVRHLDEILEGLSQRTDEIKQRVLQLPSSPESIEHFTDLEERNRRYNTIIEKSDDDDSDGDLSAPSKQFSWQAKQQSSPWATINYKTIRSLLTFTSFSTLLCLGIKNLLNKNGNKKFALFATAIGVSGSACMLYDFCNKHR